LRRSRLAGALVALGMVVCPESLQGLLVQRVVCSVVDLRDLTR